MLPIPQSTLTARRILRLTLLAALLITVPRHSRAETLPAGETPCFTIQRITLTGEAAAQFEWALAAADPPDDPATGRCLGSRGIDRVMTRLQNAVVARGFVTTRILAAAQDLSQGTLTFTVLPGRVQSIRFTADSNARATQWNALPLQPGDLLDLRAIEQALENFKRVPTADAQINITPATDSTAVPGASDLEIRWTQSLPARVTLSLDDAGSTESGKLQGSATLSLDHLWALHDLLYVSLQHNLTGGPHRTRAHTVQYQVPWGWWLFGTSLNGTRFYQRVAGATQPYLYSGRSQTGDVRLGRILWRAATRKTGVHLRGWVRTSANFVDDTEIEVQRRRMAGWDLGLTHRQFLGSATVDASLTWRHGTGMAGALPAPEEEFGEGTARPRLIVADAQLTLPFSLAGQRLRYGGAWRAQWQRTPLIKQDHFLIGNRHTVRGFDGQTNLAGERGWLIRNDLGWSLPATGHEFYLGLDHGRVGGPATTTQIGTRLTGAVLGLRGAWRGLTWDLFVGGPLVRPTGFRTAGTTAGFNLVWTH